LAGLDPELAALAHDAEGLIEALRRRAALAVAGGNMRGAEAVLRIAQLMARLEATGRMGRGGGFQRAPDAPEIIPDAYQKLLCAYTRLDSAKARKAEAYSGAASEALGPSPEDASPEDASPEEQSP
jgi:hypothetical protein